MNQGGYFQITDCPAVSTSSPDYILEAVTPVDKCCAVVKRSKCKHGDMIFEVSAEYFAHHPHHNIALQLHDLVCDEMMITENSTF